VGDLGNGLKIGDVIARVANALNVDGLGLVVNGSSNVLWLIAVHELGRDAQALKQDLELVVGTAVQVGRRNNVVTGVRERRDGHELRGLPGRGRNSGNTTLEGRDSLLENINRGAVGDAE